MAQCKSWLSSRDMDESDLNDAGQLSRAPIQAKALRASTRTPIRHTLHGLTPHRVLDQKARNLARINTALGQQYTAVIPGAFRVQFEALFSSVSKYWTCSNITFFIRTFIFSYQTWFPKFL